MFETSKHMQSDLHHQFLPLSLREKNLLDILSSILIPQLLLGLYIQALLVLGIPWMMSSGFASLLS
jgi:hypothetical protein